MAKKESKQKVGFLMVGLKITQESEQCCMMIFKMVKKTPQVPLFLIFLVRFLVRKVVLKKKMVRLRPSPGAFFVFLSFLEHPRAKKK